MRTQAIATGQRIFGLDVMRAAAIMLVVAVHAGILLDAHWPAHAVLSGIDGVDVFFVLSGFLIGRILLRLQDGDVRPWPLRLLAFWQRRWLRTLPNYYLFLLVNVALLHWSIAPGLLNWNVLAYFAFLQNVIIPLDLFFWESWSLAVEEWFYLLFPVTLAALSLLLSNMQQRMFLLAVVLFLLLPLVHRIQISQGIHEAEMADLFVRRMVFARLDTIGFGLLAAWVQDQRPQAWKRARMIAAGLGTIVLIVCVELHGNSSLKWSMIGQPTLLAVGIALLLPILSTWETLPRWGAPVVFISKIAYAWYLVHMPLRYVGEGFLVDRSALVTVLLYLLFWLVGALLSAVVYRWWERPWMALRERWVPR